ncbi:MAG: hypothetical protein FJZ43_00620 [Candidatus Staskawiczbacteria bacterium]|nr:hypothetical protein [Candidatus Staskawiczbacteria bacterium]
MKYFEYGVRTHESKGFIGQFGEKPNKQWEMVMDALTRLGIQGWEVYQVVNKNDVVHFFLKREISQTDAERIYGTKDEETYPLGFVDHIKK